MKKIILSAFLCASLFFSAQTKNSLLDQGFWKSKPSVEYVQAEISKGNNASQFNPTKMDPAVLAIINDAPFETIKFLVEQPGNGVNKVTHEGRTYLHWAGIRGNYEAIKYLIEKGSDVNLKEEHGFDMLNIISTNGVSKKETFELLEKNGVKINKKYDDGSTALLLGMSGDKDFSLTDYLQTKGLSIKDTDKAGNTAIDYAARGGNVFAMKKLFSSGIKPTNNALIFAAEGTRRTANTLDTYKYIVEDLKIKPTVVNKNGESILHLITKKQNQADNVKYFLEKGLDVNKVDNEGNTPFMNASGGRDIATLQLMLPKVSNINAINAKGESALSQAVKNGSSEVVNFLIEKGADTQIIDKAGNTLAYYWVQSYKAPRGGGAPSGEQKDDMAEKLKTLQSKGVDFSKAQSEGNTLYHTAIVKTDLNLLKKLESLNINIDALNEEGMTVLHKAALISKNDEILKYLLSLGAKKDIKTEFGETAYDLASENEYLTKNKINIDFLK